MTAAEMTATATATPTAGELVSAKTVCLILKIGRFGNSRKASLAGAKFSNEDPSQEPDKTLLSLRKTLLDSPELVAIQKHDSALTSRIRQIAFTSYFKGGVHLIPLTQIGEVESILTSAIPVRKALVDAAVVAYPTRIAETCDRLGVTANTADYPSEDRFRSTFYLEYSYVTFETPSRLKAISADIFKAEAEKARAKLESVAVECQQAMRAGLLQLVDHLADRLSPDNDGKPKRLHETAIAHLNDFLSTFELRDVTDDEQLGSIVEQARQVMAGLDRKVLKSDELIRQKVVEGLTEIKIALDPLVLDKETRAITFEDEE